MTKPASGLRVVGEDEAPAKSDVMTVTAAAESGTQRDLLIALRARIAKTVTDPKTPPRDLAALSRRLMDIANEIEAIDSEDGDDDIGDAAETPDQDFDSSAI